MLRVRVLVLGTLLALGTALAPSLALASGARPWFAPAPSTTDNATAAAENATDNASGNATGGQAAPAAANATPAPPANAAPGPAHFPRKPLPEAKPDDPAALAQYAVLRQYYERMLTLDDRMPQVFSRRVRDEEAMAFLTMREIQRRRGLLERFRMARVDLEKLVFTRITADPDLARIIVTGSYTLAVPPMTDTVEEDALFVLLPEDGGWKIFERREGAR